MLLRRRTADFLVGFLTLTVVLAMAPSASAAMDRPTWTSGDNWVYALQSAQANITTNGTLRMDVVGTESVVVNGSSYSSYRVKASVTFAVGSLSLTIPADMWFNTATLAIVKITAVLNLSFGNQALTSTLTVSGNPPQAINWPLTSGASWSSSTIVTSANQNSNGSMQSSAQSLTTDFLAQPDQQVSVPAGTFAAVPLRETDRVEGSYSVNYWSSQVGNWALVEFYNSTGQKQSTLKLTSYSYQGGGFFSIVFVGLPVSIWLGLLAIVVIGLVAFALLRRKRFPPVVMPPAGPPTPPESPDRPPPGSPP